MNEQDHSGFEQKLRAKLEGVQFTPPVTLKAKVFEDYKHTHRRKRFLWWLFGGLGLGAGTLALLIILSETKPITNQEEKAFSTLELNVQAMDKSQPNRPVIQNKTSPIEDVSAIIEEPQRSSQAERIKANNDGISPNTAFDFNIDYQESTEEGGNQLSSALNNSFNTELVETDLAINVLMDSTSNESDATTNSVGLSLNASRTLLPLNGDVEAVEVKANNIGLIPTRFTQPIYFVEKATSSILSRNVDLNPSAPPKESDIEACDLRYITGVSGGIGISYRTLNSNVHHELVNHKNMAEHAAISSSAGVYGVARLYKHFGFKSGLTFLRVGERYHFENDHASHETVNTYSYLNLDLKLNQTLFCSGPLRLDFAVGTKVNLLTNAQSSWLDPHSFEAVFHENTGQHSPFRDYNLVWSADFTSYYFFSRKGFVGLTVEADRFHNSVYKDAVGLDQRPYAIQTYFNIGFRF